MFGVSRNRKQRFRRGAEQDVVDLARILKCQPADLLRQRKHDVEIWNRQQFSPSCRQPFCARRGLTLWTMPVAARIIRDDAMPALVALLHILPMAAEGGRAAVANRFEGLSLPGAENMSPLCEEFSFVGAEHIGHLGPMRLHRRGGTVLAARTRSRPPSISSGLLVERTVLSATCRYRAVVFRFA